jgi:hypothetical protein
MKGTHIFLERVNFGRFVNLHMAVQSGSSQWAVAQPVTFVVTDDNACHTQPALQLEPGRGR